MGKASVMPYVFVGLNDNDKLLVKPFKTAVRCYKRDCYFCQRMIGVKKAVVYKKTRAKKVKIIRPYKKWTAKDIETLKRMALLPTSEIVGHVNHSKDSIQNMKYVLRREAGIRGHKAIFKPLI